VRVNLRRSTVQRIVRALAQENLLMAATPKARVRLGPTLAQLAAGADVGLERLARPIMRRLSRLTEETVDHSVLGRDTAVFVEQVQGTQRLAAVSAVGMPFPLHCTANGKALLAQLKPERREHLLADRLERYTDATIKDRAALDTELRDVESSGLAFDLEEHSAGICAIGTAFRDPLGREYSLSIPVPRQDFRASGNSSRTC
jgi:DNA-binding IclR family transcriptional regulator